MKKILLAVAVIGALTANAFAVISGSKHDFSGTGGTYNVPGDTCLACHTPHKSNSSAPLWGRTNTLQSFTLNGTDDIAGTKSFICMSCHDGTVAIGDSVLVDTVGGLIGTGLTNNDLTATHPIGRVYGTAGTGDGVNLQATPTNNIPLDNTKVSCTSCHDVHNGTGEARFVRVGVGLCTSCHIK